MIFPKLILFLRNTVLGSVLFAVSVALHAQPVIDQPDMMIDKATKDSVVAEANRVLIERYLDLPLAQKMVGTISQKQTSGAYNSITSAKQFAQKLTDDYRAVSKDLHLSVLYSHQAYPEPGTLPPPPPDWQERNRRVFGRLYNFGLVRAEILEGNVGIVTLEGFPPVDLMKDTLAAVMQFVAYTDALIIDTRQTAGGDPAAVAQMISYFLPAEKTKTNTVYYRFGNRTDEFFTTVALAGPRYLDRPLFVVIGPETFSANEEFAYDLQQFKRATLIGQTTAGAANPAGFTPVHRHFGLSVPMGKVINPISGTNWERIGVKPDLRAADWYGVQLAYVQAIEKILAHNPSPLTPEDRTKLEATLKTQKVTLAKLMKFKRAPKKDPPQQP